MIFVVVLRTKLERFKFEIKELKEKEEEKKREGKTIEEA